MRGPKRISLMNAGALIVATFAVVAVLAPVLAPHDPRALTGDALQRPSSQHLLGTNHVGQDLFSQLIWGARSSLLVALGAATLAVLTGLAVGVGAGLVGGMAEILAMRVVDVFLALPLLPLLVVVAALASPSLGLVTLVIGMTTWPAIARIVRAQTRTLRSRGFVRAARGFGAGSVYVVRRHVAPALGPVLSTWFVNVAAIAVLLEAGLGFLGLSDPTAVSWGSVLNEALRHQGLYFTTLWTWWVLPAGIAISIAVLAFTFLAVGLEPWLRPQLARRS